MVVLFFNVNRTFRIVYGVNFVYSFLLEEKIVLVIKSLLSENFMFQSIQVCFLL